MVSPDFAQIFLDAINEDENYRKLNARIIAPHDEQRRKAQRSTAIGTALAHIIGIGWVKRALSVIIFNENPLFTATIADDKKYPKSYSDIAFAKVYKRRHFPAKKAILYFKPKKKGLIKKEIIGMTFKAYGGEIPGRKKIENDSKLIDKLLILCKNKVIHGFEAPEYPFGIVLHETEGSTRAIIATKVDKDSSRQMLRKLFACVLTTITHIENELNEHTVSTVKFITESEALDMIKKKLKDIP